MALLNCCRFSRWSLVLLLTQALVVLMLSSAFGEPFIWTEKAAMPTPTSRASRAVLDGKLWVLGGETSSGISSAVFAYDPVSNSWESRPGLGEPRFLAAEAVVDGNIYLIGGAQELPPVPLSSIMAYGSYWGTYSPAGSLQTARVRAGAAYCQGKVYVFGGIGTGGVLDTFEEYDNYAGQSIVRGTMPAAREGAAVVAVDDVIYIIGGNDAGGNPTSTCWMYHPGSNTFTEKAPLPYPHSGKAAVYSNGVIYLAGGATAPGNPPATWTTDVRAYHIATDTWSTPGSFPTSRYAAATGVIKNTIYIAGGDNASSVPHAPLAVTEAADLPLPEGWSSKAPLPESLSRAFSAVVDGSVYVLGGAPATANVRRYDPGSDSWSDMLPLPAPLFGGATAAQGDIIYLAGGFDGMMNLQGSVIAYNTTDGTHNFLGSLVQPRARFNGAILNNKFYLVGGDGTSNRLDSIEAFDLSTNMSSIVGTLPEPSSLAGVVAVGTKLYIISGGNNNDLCWSFDPYTGQFTRLAPFPLSGTSVRTVHHRGDKIYAVASWAVGGVNAVLEYDIPSDTWNTISAVPAERNVPTCEVVDDVLHVIGGDLTGNKNEAFRLPQIGLTIISVGTLDNAPFGSAMGWSTTELRSLITAGDYLEVNGTWYLVAASSVNGWLPGGANHATLVQVDQGTKAPLVDGAGQPVFADLTPHWNSVAILHSLGTPAGMLPLDVYTSGTGTVTDDASRQFGMTSRLVPSGTSFNLTATPAAEFSFGGWSGCDAVSGHTCTANVTYPLSVEAAFGAGTVTPSAPMDQPRMDHGSVLLSYDRVMVLFGNDGFGSITPSTLIYDRGTGSWSAAAPLSSARYGSSATLLSDGRVLVAGGSTTEGEHPTLAQIYDPASNSWSAAGNLNTPRAYHTAVLLANGRVLVAGGEQFGAGGASVEIYDPSTNSWYPAEDMLQLRAFHAATLLPDGRVLVSGGLPVEVSGNPSVPSAEIYDPFTGNWIAASNMQTSRSQHLATLLYDGRVLITGGIEGGTRLVQQAEIFDPYANGWTAAGVLATGRVDHSATLLPDGRVLVAGGENPFTGVHYADTEIYDPVLNRFDLGAPLSVARANHSATLLGNGQLLLAGGCSNDAGRLSSTEIYTPQGVILDAPFLLSLTVEGNGEVQSVPSGMSCYGGACQAEFPGGVSVQLVASEPADSVFIGWSGCDSVKANICTVTMLGAREVQALYVPGPARFLPAAGLLDPFYDHSATMLPNGKVLVTGWGGPNGDAELYDVAANNWTPAAGMLTRRSMVRAVLLPDGRVLVTGGEWDWGVAPTRGEIYDPSTGSWTFTGNMNSSSSRSQHTVTLLANGQVLDVGGSYSTVYGAAELYDPATNQWVATASLSQTRYAHTANLLPDGRVLVAGGMAQGFLQLDSVEIYDPATGLWSAGPPLSLARSGHTATLLVDGRLLVAGGDGVENSQLASAELFDPVTNTWSDAGFLLTARSKHTATLLQNGKVLVTGGNAGEYYEAISSAEIYDPATSLWSAAGDLFDARGSHSATPLPGGKVLITGGLKEYGPLATAEIYGPGAPLPEDLVAPVSVITTPGGTVPKLVVSGTAGDGTGTGVRRVEVMVNNDGVWRQALGTVNWQYDFDMVQNGDYYIVVRAVDYAGNVEVPGPGLAVTLAAPISIGIASPVAGGSLSGVSPKVVGTASAYWGMDRVEVTLDGGTTWSAATGWDHWNFALPQQDGSYTVQARLCDAAGNVALSAPVSFTIDSVPPTVSAEVSSNTLGAGGWHVIPPTVTLTASDGQPGAYCEYRMDGSPTWTRYYAPFTVYSGTHMITFRARDAAGNPSSEWSLEVKVDQEFAWSQWWGTGPFGAYIRAVAVSPDYRNDQTIMVGTNEAGIFRSTDGGYSWNKVSVPAMTSGYVHSLAFSPNYATDRTVFAGNYNGVFRSTDRGATWELATGIDMSAAYSVMSLKVSPNFEMDGTVLAGTERSSMYRSTDWGRTFSKVSFTTTNDALRSISFSPGYMDDNTVYTGSNAGRGVFRSTDGGATWSACGTLPGGSTIYSLDSAENGVVFVHAGGGVLRSNDSCGTWTNVNATGGYVAVSPGFTVDSTVIAGSSRSFDGGATWNALESGGGIIAFSPDYARDDTVFSGTYLGMRKGTFRGDIWSDINEGIFGKNVSSFAASPNFLQDTTIFVGLNSGGVYRSTQGGIMWEAVNTGITDTAITSLSVSPAFATDGTVFASARYGRVFRSTDSGLTWSQAANVSSRNGTQVGVSPNFATDRTVIAGFDETETSGHYGVIKRSTDGGTTWSTVKTYASSSGAFNAMVYSPAFAADRTVFLGSQYSLATSRDGGSTWTLSYVGSSGVYGLAISPAYASDATIFSAGPAGVYKSTDGGYTWSPASSGLPVNPSTGNPLAVRAVAVSPEFVADGTVFAGTDSGVYLSRDAGGSWRPFNESLGISKVRVLAVAPNWAITKRIYAGGYYGSTWTTNLFSYPSSEIGYPLPGNLTTRSFTITGTAADLSNGSGLDYVEVSTDGGQSWQRAQGLQNWSLPVTLPADGSYTIQSRAHDLAGNTGAAATASVTVDTVLPSVSIVTPPPGLVATRTPILAYAASDGSVTVRLDGIVIPVTSGAVLGPLAEGEHTVRVEAVDPSGNPGVAEVRFKVDTTAPGSAIVAPIAGSSLPAMFTVSGTAGDGAGGGVRFVEVTADGGGTWVRASGTTSWSAQMNIPQPGQYLLQSRAADNAGNVQATGPGTSVTVGSSLPLQLTIEGNGAVHSQPFPDLNCQGGSCTEWYLPGTMVQLTATPGAGYAVNYWSGCDRADGNVCYVLVQGGRSVRLRLTPATGGPPWSGRAPMPVPVARMASEAVNGKMYLLGGNTSGRVQTATVQSYDPVADAWQQSTSLPVPLLGAVSVASGPFIYLAGGETANGVYSDAIYRYDAPMGQVERIGTLTAPRFRMNAALLNGKMYLFGGIGSNGMVLDTVEEIDLETGLSSVKTMLPHPVTLAGAETVGDRIYVFGGSNDGGTLGATWAYDPVTNVFEPRSPMPYPTEVHPSAVHDGKIYVAGGMDMGTLLGKVQVYQPSGDQWSTTTDLAALRFASAGEVIDGTLYLAGGFNWEQPVISSTEALPLWTQWRVHNVGPPNIAATDPKFVVDWKASSHGMLQPGGYLKVGGTYYRVLGGKAGTWDGPDYIAAGLQKVNQQTGEPLYDANGNLLLPDLRGMEGADLESFSSWPVPPWKVYSSGPSAGNQWGLPDSSGIDWDSAAHGTLVTGSYVRIGGIFYLVIAAPDSPILSGSWNGGAFHSALLQQCDQATGAPLTDGSGNPVYAFTNGLAWQTIEAFASWPIPADGAPPVTVARIECPRGGDGSCTSNATVTLEATDAGSGVLFTEYMIDDDGRWTNYSGPLTLTKQGTTRIHFRSVDVDQNTESTRQTEVVIKIPFWQSSGPYGGNIREIVFSSRYATDRTVFSSGFYAGIYRSVDGGSNWAAVTSELSNKFINAIALSPRYDWDHTIFAGTTDGGVYRSLDAGTTWTLLATGIPAGKSIFDIQVSPDYANDGTLYVSADLGSGVYRSVDRGESWQQIDFGGTTPHIGALALSPNFAVDRTMYGGDTWGGGLKRSTDGGNTWSTCTYFNGPSNYINNVVVANDGTVFATNSTEYTYRSTDGCQSWSFAVENLTNSLAVSPDFATDRTVFAGGHRSTDGGVTWTRVISGYSHVVAVSPGFAADEVVLSGTDLVGISRSTDRGDTWSSSTAGILGLNIVDVVASPDFATDNTLFAAGDSAGLYRSTDGGATWTLSNAGITETGIVSISISPSFASDRTVFAASRWKLYRSTDAGGTWTPVKEAVAEEIKAVSVSPDFATDRTALLIMMRNSVGFDHDVYRSTDGGTTWVKGKSLIGSTDPVTIAFSPSFAADGTVFATTVTMLYRSTDRGLNWSAYSPAASIQSVALSPDFALDGKVYIGTWDGLYRSTDRGATWSRMGNAGLPLRENGYPVLIYSLSITGGAGDRLIFAGTDSGVFQSADEGHSWNEVNVGLPGVKMRNLILSPSYENDRKIFGGGYYGSVWTGAPVAFNGPVASFTGTPLTGFAPLLVNLADTSINTPTGWFWEFGDGGSTDMRNPTHAFSNPGTYRVKLTVTNPAGTHSREVFDYVTVLACPNDPVRLESGSSFDTMQAAFDSATSGATIMAQGIDFTGDVVLSRDVTIVLKGGYDCGYTGNPVAANMQGALRVTAGTLKVENLVFK